MSWLGNPSFAQTSLPFDRLGLRSISRYYWLTSPLSFMTFFRLDIVSKVILEFCISTWGVNMFTMNSNVSFGENISCFVTNLFSSISFRSRMSLTRQRRRLTYEIMIFTKRRPAVDSCSWSRLSRNMRAVESGVLNSWEIVIWSLTSKALRCFDSRTWLSSFRESIWWVMS